MSDKVLEVNAEGTANAYKFVLTKGCYLFDLEWFSLKLVHPFQVWNCEVSFGLKNGKFLIQIKI